MKNYSNLEIFSVILKLLKKSKNFRNIFSKLTKFPTLNFLYFLSLFLPSRKPRRLFRVQLLAKLRRTQNLIFGNSIKFFWFRLKINSICSQDRQHRAHWGQKGRSKETKRNGKNLFAKLWLTSLMTASNAVNNFILFAIHY